MAHQTLHLRVLSRNLSVNVPPESVPALQRAETDLSGRLIQLQRQYGIHDESYLLAMCCLQYALELAAEHEAQAERVRTQQQGFTTQLQTLNDEVVQALRSLGA